MNPDEVREMVRQKYAKVVTQKTECCGSSSCCGSTAMIANPVTGGLYTSSNLDGLPPEAVNASLGCGNPTALIELHPGETVLDLGSGAGLDVLLSARRVGQYGKAYGLDMTDEMLAEANMNKAKAGVVNAEFVKGNIEAIPLPESAVDVVISNCVINLSADKDQVFQEIHRVLKAGGRLGVSDIVTTKPLPDSVRETLLNWAGCMSGALTDEAYKAKLSKAGFENIELEITRTYDLNDPSVLSLVPELANAEHAEWNGAVVSAFIRAKKPARHLTVDKDFCIRLAEPEDFSQIHELLSESGLPTAGVSPCMGTYYLASEKGLIGVIGYEPYGTVALLRSLAIKSSFRKTGVAGCLIDHVLQELKRAGFSELYLLTNTAASYLAKFGFAKVDRNDVPAIVLTTSALGDACPASSTCMHSKL